MATPDFEIKSSVLTVHLGGNLTHVESPAALFQAAQNLETKKVSVLTEGLKAWDSTLVSILFELQNISHARKIGFEAKGLPQGLARLLALAQAVPQHVDTVTVEKEPFLDKLGGWGINLFNIFLKGWHFTAENLAALGRFATGKTAARKVDFLFALEDCGPKALGIVSLISFMVGLILAFVGAIQLKTFGAQVYVASLVTIGMIRIMGAIMAGIIMAGRTGASFAATLGTMQVNEEIDALKTMGVPVSEFLVLPRLAALVIAMPILTMLADFMGMLGGAFVGVLLLDIPAVEYWRYSWQAWGLTNFFVGLFHGFVFGFIISLCGCYYGINSGRNADGVGVATTKAVVAGIVWMIIATGFITFCCERLGI